MGVMVSDLKRSVAIRGQQRWVKAEELLAQVVGVIVEQISNGGEGRAYSTGGGKGDGDDCLRESTVKPGVGEGECRQVHAIQRQ